ncbi:MAG: hypothetical protein ACXVJT_18095, partial [Thermoanaerobaculia bacterium]
QMVMTRRIAVLSFVSMAMCVFAAEAREGFGFSKRAVTMTRTIPPSLNVTATHVNVTARAERSSNSDDAQSLRKYTEDMLTSGSRFAVGNGGGVGVNLSLNRLDSHETWETKTDYESRPYTRRVYNENKKRYEDKTEYRSVPVEKQVKVVSGAISGTYTITDRRGDVIDSGALDSSFNRKYPEGKDSPTPQAVEDDLLKRAAANVASRLVPTTDRVSVLMPKGSFEDFIPIAEGGAWDRYLSAVESVPEKRDRGSEAYRQYALAVAKEGVAYMTTDPQRATDLLRESVQHYNNAISYNPNEPLFHDRYESLLSPSIDPAVVRATASLTRYEAWRTMPVAVARSGPAHSMDRQAGSSPRVMRNETVIEMSAAGLSDENIILAIKAAKTAEFDLSPHALISLAKNGVSKNVIAQMQKKK